MTPKSKLPTYTRDIFSEEPHKTKSKQQEIKYFFPQKETNKETKKAILKDKKRIFTCEKLESRWPTPPLRNPKHILLLIHIQPRINDDRPGTMMTNQYTQNPNHINHQNKTKQKNPPQTSKIKIKTTP